MSTIDFSNLDDPVSAAERRPHLRYLIRETETLWTAFAMLACVIILLAVLAMPPIARIATVGFILVYGILWVLDARDRVNYRARLARFAQVNGLTLTVDERVDLGPGMYFTIGTNRHVLEMLEFSAGAKIGRYQYTLKRGRHRVTLKNNFICIKLSRRLPHIVLDAKKGNYWASSLPQSFDKSQVVSLEGDFDKYFTVYGPSGYERDIRYVLTPDVMQAFIQYADGFDVEIIDDNLYVYAQDVPLTSKRFLQSAIQIIGVVGSELENQSDRYRDAAVGAGIDNQVAKSGQRLQKSAMVWLYTIMAYIFVNMVSSMIQPFAPTVGLAIYYGGVAFIVVSVVMRLYLHRRKSGK